MIEVNHLTKRYGNNTAVSDLSFSIEKGQIYGFLGPNGAGKSTTMNIMTGCLAATGGEVRIGGYDIFEQPMEAKRLIGYLPEQPPLYPDRTPREYLTFVARAKGIARGAVNDEIEHAMAVTQIQNVADRLIKNLSKGYKQRVGIAQAILGSPEVIILDEPTVGLDPRQIMEIRDLIQELGREHTVILSSHILSEVQAVCDRIMIISKGKLVACDTPQNLEKLFAGSVSVRLTAEASVEEIRQILDPLPYITDLIIEPVEETEEDQRQQVWVYTDSSDGNGVCRDIFFAFSHGEKAILQMSMDKASLEDIFLELTGGSDTAEIDEVQITENKNEEDYDYNKILKEYLDAEELKTEQEKEDEQQ